MIAAMSNNMRPAGIRKAAILVASLDQAAADMILDQLAPESADLVRRAVMTIDQIDPEEQQRVIDEFRRIGYMVPDRHPAGIDLDGPMAYQFSSAATWGGRPNSEDSNHATDARIREEPSTTPFAFLHSAEEESLSRLLAGERPQTIALVLSHLPPEQAGKVLVQFPAPLQAEVIRRLSDLEKTDPQTLREIEQAIETRLSRQFASERRAAEPTAVTRILHSCDSQTVGNILGNLAEHDPKLAERFGYRRLDFDELDQLDDDALFEAFQAVEPQVAVAALLGAPPLLVERVLRQMPPENAKILRRKLDRPAPIRLSDIEEARLRVAAAASPLHCAVQSKTAFAA